jgi:hypothetical protein
MTLNDMKWYEMIKTKLYLKFKLIFNECEYLWIFVNISEYIKFNKNID